MFFAFLFCKTTIYFVNCQISWQVFLLFNTLYSSSLNLGHVSVPIVCLNAGSASISSSVPFRISVRVKEKRPSAVCLAPYA